jgi:hypothetical protein
MVYLTTPSIFLICLSIYGSHKNAVRPDLGICGFMFYLATISVVVYKYYILDITHSPVYIPKQCFGGWILSLSPEIGTSSFRWPQLSRFHLKTETVSSLRNIVSWNINRMEFSDKDKTMDNIQKHNTCTKKLYSMVWIRKRTIPTDWATATCRRS